MFIMLLSTFVSEFIALIRLISGSELHPVEDKNMTNENQISLFIDDLNRKLDFIEFCESTNLNCLVITDEESSSIIVSFGVSHPKFKECFEYYNITLRKQRKIENYSLVRNRDDGQGGASHEFKNVACGIYEITIHPCYNSWQCAPFIIRYPESVNMTSFDCNGLVIGKQFIPEQQYKKIIVIVSITSVLLALTFSMLIFYYYRSEIGSRKVIPLKQDECISIEEEDSPASKIEVYIIHYYGKNIQNKWKIKTFKEFCLLTGYFDSVKTITDELSLILLNVNDHLDRMLEKRGNDGNLKKIVLFASDNDEEDDAYEQENIIFFKFIDKVRDNIKECLQGYDHFFVVKLDSSVNCPEMLKGIVKRNRFIFSDELMDDHLINLCLNICSGSNLNMSTVERNLRKLLDEHPFYLESTV